MKWIVGLIIVSWAFIFWMLNESDSMRKCQERHSFETCQHTLYR